MGPYITEVDYVYSGTLYDVRYVNSPEPFSALAPNASAAFAGRSYLQVLHDLYTGRVPVAPDGTPDTSVALGVFPFNPDTPTGTGVPPAGLLDSTLDFKRAANENEFSKNDSENITLNFDYRLGEHTLSVVASQIDYSVEERIDADFTPVPILATDQSEDYEQRFFKVDYNSPQDTFLEVFAGASFLDSELTFDENISNGLEREVTNQEVADFLLGLVDDDSAPNISQDNQFNSNEPFATYFGRTIPTAAQALRIFDLNRKFSQTTEITSAYMDLKFNFSDRLRARLGARYTHAEKVAVRDFAFLTASGEPWTGFSELAASAANFSGATADEAQQRFAGIINSLGRIFNFQPHSDRIPMGRNTIPRTGTGQLVSAYPVTTAGIGVESSVPGCENQYTFALGGPCDPNPEHGPRREEQFLPSAVFEFDLTPDFSMYLGASMANKLGGFDARSNATPEGKADFGVDPGTFVFEDEDALSYELGFTWYLPAGWGELRAAAFYTDYKNLPGQFGRQKCWPKCSKCGRSKFAGC